MHLSCSYLLGEGVDEKRLIEYIPEIEEKALCCISQGDTKVTFKCNEFVIMLVPSSEIKELETDDEYCLLIQLLEEN